jgi:hypothetical protein
MTIKNKALNICRKIGFPCHAQLCADVEAVGCPPTLPTGYCSPAVVAATEPLRAWRRLGPEAIVDCHLCRKSLAVRDTDAGVLRPTCLDCSRRVGAQN